MKTQTGPVIDRKIPDLLSVAEVATMLDMSRQAVLKMINTGRLPAKRVGGAWVVREATLTGLKVEEKA